MNIGYIGLGRMGFNIAKNINYKFKTFIWNRTEYTAIKHSNLYNTNNVSLETLAKKSDINHVNCLSSAHTFLNNDFETSAQTIFQSSDIFILLANISHHNLDCVKVRF